MMVLVWAAGFNQLTQARQGIAGFDDDVRGRAGTGVCHWVTFRIKKMGEGKIPHPPTDRSQRAGGERDQAGWACFAAPASTAARSVSFARWLYRAVLATLACPRTLPTAKRSTPEFTMKDAAL